ncbi:MAG TPA: 2-phosphosulfolactate phosphatase, partial [Polyangia bacterium]
MSLADQSGFDVRCEWGVEGVEALVGCRTFIVVDVLSFSTCVAVAVDRGVLILPQTVGKNAAVEKAVGHHVVAAGPRGSGYSLSPGSLLEAPAGMTLALPSPNGAAVSLKASGRGHVLAGCLRNRTAVGRRAMALGGPFGLIAAGERWDDGTPRWALEDLIGVGAVAQMLPGAASPEASAAIAVFRSVANELLPTL